MRVGLGTGTTARWFILGLAARVRQGLKLRAVATSVASAALAREHGMVVEELGADGLDIAVDGADSVDPSLRLIKGRGGAMLREKIVAASAARFVVIADDSKYMSGLRGRIPVEVVHFGSARSVRALADRTVLGIRAPHRSRRRAVHHRQRQPHRGQRVHGRRRPGGHRRRDRFGPRGGRRTGCSWG